MRFLLLLNKGRKLFFRWLSRRLPARDARLEVLDIRVAEFLCGFRSTGIGAAMLTAAVGDNQRGLVGWQEFSEIGSVGCVVDGTRNMAVGIGDGTVHIEQGHLLGGDIRLEISEADVREGAGKGIQSEEKGSGQEEMFLHVGNLPCEYEYAS